MLCLEPQAPGRICLVMEDAMTDDVKLPRKLSQEPEAPTPRRASQERVIEELDRWANSPGLQPPRSQHEKTI